MVKAVGAKKGSPQAQSSIGVKHAQKIQTEFASRQLARVIQLLKEKPEQIPIIIDLLEQNSLIANDVHGEMFHGSYTRQVPKVWLAAWLMRRQSLFTPEVLEQLEIKCGDIVRLLTQFATGVDFRHWMLPRGATHKVVLQAVLDARYDAFGRRLSDEWFKLSVDVEAATVSWTHGAFRLSFDASTKLLLGMRNAADGSETEMPAEYCIHGPLLLHNNWTMPSPSWRRASLSCALPTNFSRTITLSSCACTRSSTRSARCGPCSTPRE